MTRVALGLAVAAILCGISSGPARAGLIPVAPGYKITTFASGFAQDGAGEGPFGIGFTNSGTVMVADRFGVVRTFTDVDGQTVGSALTSFQYTASTLGVANAAGKMYLADQGSEQILQLNNDGSFNQAIINYPGGTSPTGLTATSNGNLFVSNRGPGTVGPGTIDLIDPAAKTATRFENVGGNIDYDGLQVSPDGKILYVATDTNHILGFDTSNPDPNKAPVFDSGPVTLAVGRVDGMALGEGNIAGNIFVNTNGGQVIEINISTLAETLIADGGTRGDFVGVDPNGTLLLTQSTEIDRLTAPPGGSFATTPEPSGITLAGVGIAGLLAWGWRRRGRDRRARV
jgi:hypothetical protein